MKRKSKRDSTKSDRAEIPPITPEQLRRGSMGKMFNRAVESSNVVRIEPGLRKMFPNERAVNDALRALVEVRASLAQLGMDKRKPKKSA